MSNQANTKNINKPQETAPAIPEQPPLDERQAQTSPIPQSSQPLSPLPPELTGFVAPGVHVQNMDSQTGQPIAPPEYYTSQGVFQAPPSPPPGYPSSAHPPYAAGPAPPLGYPGSQNPPGTYPPTPSDVNERPAETGIGVNNAALGGLGALAACCICCEILD